MNNSKKSNNPRNARGVSYVLICRPPSFTPSASPFRRLAKFCHRRPHAPREEERASLLSMAYRLRAPRVAPQRRCRLGFRFFHSPPLVRNVQPLSFPVASSPEPASLVGTAPLGIARCVGQAGTPAILAIQQTRQPGVRPSAQKIPYQPQAPERAAGPRAIRRSLVAHDHHLAERSARANRLPCAPSGGAAQWNRFQVGKRPLHRGRRAKPRPLVARI